MTPHPSPLTPHRKTARRAVFLDRDGTLNVEKEYLHRSEDFELLPGVPEALKRLQDAGFMLVVVTNQSGIARGYYSLEDVDILHRYMCSELERYGAKLAGIYVCPHHPTTGKEPFVKDCDCRKGKPGMLLQAAAELDIDLSRSFMIGDKASDATAGLNAGCRSYLVATGHPIEPLGEIPIFTDLSAAVSAILEE